MTVGPAELLAPLLVAAVAIAVFAVNRPRAERFFTANGLDERPDDVAHVRALLHHTRVSRLAGGVVGIVLGGVSGASLGGPGALAGAGIGLLAGTMLGITVSQPRPEPPASPVRAASLSAREPRDYLPRHARTVTLGLAVLVVVYAVVAMTTAIAPLGRTIAIFVTGLATVLAVPVGRVFQRRTLELRRADVDAASVRVDDALRAAALRGIHHATLGILLCGLLLVGYGAVATQGVEGLQVRGVTVVSAPPLSTGFGFASPASATARTQLAHWTEPDGSRHVTSVPTRAVQARDAFIGTIVDHPVLDGIGAWATMIGFFGALLEWWRAAGSWRRPQATPTATAVVAA